MCGFAAKAKIKLTWSMLQKKIEQICLCLQDLLSANTQHLNISAAGTA